VKVLAKDVEVLCACNVMDYSLLLGIEELQPGRDSN